MMAFLGVLTLVATACGSAGGETGAASDGDDGSGGDGGSGGKEVVRFAFSPDHIMEYLIDTGTLAEMEEEWNVRLEMTSTWDEFTFFAGGHGDIVSTATYELPLLEKETGVDTVTFGKYAKAKMAWMVPADSDAETLADLQGQTVSVPGPTGATLVWGAYAKEAFGVDFLFEGGDYDVVVNTVPATPELVARGEVDACICPPNLAAKQLREGELRILHDGATASQFYAEEIGEGHDGVMENVFTARKEWYDNHPHEVAFFNALWEEGLRLWQEERAEIVGLYPQHFAVEDEADIEWMAEYLSEDDWTADTAYLDEEWIEGEKKLFDLMKSTGFMEEDAPEPEFAALEPESS